MIRRKTKHQHYWKTTGTVYVNPAHGKVENISEEMLRELTFGVTILTQQCEDCGWVDSSRHVGKLIVPGLTRVDD